MAKYLVNTARTLIFSTALPPPAVAGAMAALELLREQPGPRRQAAAQRRDAARGARRRGARQRQPRDPDPAARDRRRRRPRWTPASRRSSAGVFAQAIRPPTVPHGTSRLRLAVMASHTKSELREAARAIAQAVPGCVGRARAPARARDDAAEQLGAASRRSAGAAERRVVRRPRRRGREAVALRGLLRNRHRHRRRQVRPRRGHLRRAGGARRARGRVQAGRHGPRRAAPGTGRATTSCSPRRRAPARRRTTSRRHRSARPSRRTTRPSWPASRRPAALVAAARGAAAEGADALVCEGVGGLLVPLTAGYLGPRLRGRARPAAVVCGAARPRHDQPHAAHGRGGAQRGPGGRGRGDDAVARRAGRDRALEPRDDRAARPASPSPALPPATPDSLAPPARAADRRLARRRPPYHRWRERPRLPPRPSPDRTARTSPT